MVISFCIFCSFLDRNLLPKEFLNLKKVLCAGHGKEVEDESSLQADLKRSASLDKVILVREWLKEVDGKIRLERTETR